MNLLKAFKRLKNCGLVSAFSGLFSGGTVGIIWAIIQPFVIKLIQKKVPGSITKLYENLAKYSQPAVDSLFKLKEKIEKSPSELDDYCFNQGVSAIERFANYLIRVSIELRS